MTRWHFSIQGLRHHSALAWLQVPSSSTTPSMFAAGCRAGRSSPRPCGRSRRSRGRCRGRRPSRIPDTGSPSARDRRPAVPAPSKGSATTGRSSTPHVLKCSAASRAVPSALSCSCGCCRIRSAMRLSTGVTVSQMQSGTGLRQCGHSATASAPPACSDGSDISGLYAPPRRPSMIAFCGCCDRAGRCRQPKEPPAP